MFARFDENPAMTLQDIKETKGYGWTDYVKTVYPPQTKFSGLEGIINLIIYRGQGVCKVKNVVNNYFHASFSLN